MNKYNRNDLKKYRHETKAIAFLIPRKIEMKGTEIRDKIASFYLMMKQFTPTDVLEMYKSDFEELDAILNVIPPKVSFAFDPAKHKEGNLDCVCIKDGFGNIKVFTQKEFEEKLIQDIDKKAWRND